MPRLNEVHEVATLLATMLTGEPVTHGALAVIPLLAPHLDDPDWLTLEEAGERARVTEVSEAGSVPFLKVANGADQPLLLLDGEELIGAKQNRILNTFGAGGGPHGGDHPRDLRGARGAGATAAASSARAMPRSTPPSARGRRPT